MSKNNEVSGMVGWVGFASFMLYLAGTFSLIAGFVALFKHTAVYHAATNTLWILDYSQWGWVHIIAGILAIVAAGSLMTGHMYGRIIAVLVALASAVVNMAFVPIYPIWSVIVIVIDILIIYSVVVHAGELKQD